MQTLKDKISALENNNEDFLKTIEEFAGQINTLTVEAEISRLEFVQVFDAVSDPICIIDKKHTVLRVNNAFLKLFKLKDRNSVIGKECEEILNHDLCKIDSCLLAQILDKRERIEIETNFPPKKGNILTFLLTGSPLLGLAGEIIGAVLQFRDISERKIYEKALEEKNRQLNELASIDGLTQIANRRIFDETLEKEWQRMQRSQTPIALLMLDIDFFKLYNDNYGHAQGDECLKQVAKALSNCVHRSHDLVARYGGEEFCFVLPETDLEGAAVVADFVLNAVRDCKIPHEHSKVADIITVSIGCCCVIPTGKAKHSELIIQTDQLLYKAKESGRNRVIANQ